MKRLIMLALVVSGLGSTAAAGAAAPAALSCDAGPERTDKEIANLHGQWDFLMIPRGVPSFGVMTIGFVGAAYGGSLAPSRTAPVVLRAVQLDGSNISLVVASREGDVLFNGRVSAKGDYICGTVTYHGGEVFPMIAQKRPSTYQSPPASTRR